MDNVLIRNAVERSGGPSAIGAVFGVSKQAVDGWCKHGVPPKRVLKLATILDLRPSDLRPDLYPPEYEFKAIAPEGRKETCVE
ncbi:MAG: YdaS family helix-turn-helix protein [Filomicrobium sp.]